LRPARQASRYGPKTADQIFESIPRYLPIRADEVDAVTGPLVKVDEPGSGVDDNDWFRAEGDPQR
jgi:hypothetical protein